MFGLMERVTTYSCTFRYNPKREEYEVDYFTDDGVYKIGDGLYTISYSGEIEEACKSKRFTKLEAVKDLLNSEDYHVRRTMTNSFLESLGGSSKDIEDVKRKVFRITVRREIERQKGFFNYIKYLWNNYGIEGDLDYNED